MSTVAFKSILHHCGRENPNFRLHSRKLWPSYLNCASTSFSNCRSSCNFRPPTALPVRASSADTAAIVTSGFIFEETFALKRIEKVEGKIYIRLDNGKDEDHWQLTVGCNVPGKWVLHWGVNYAGDVGSEWDQPPLKMRPQGSIPIKDYAIETPLKQSTTASEKDTLHEVKIDFDTESTIVAINFVLKDEETGVWYQHRGRDFKVALADYFPNDGNVVGAKKSIGIWSGALGQLSNILLHSEGPHPKGEDSNNEYPDKQKRHLEGFYEEYSIVKDVPIDHSLSVCVRKCPETAKNLLLIETNLPGEVVVHWGVSKNDNSKWEIPATPYPAETIVFKNKALQTLLQHKEGGEGSWGLFTLDEGFVAFLFVVKLKENMWLNCMGNDFCIPLSQGGSHPQFKDIESDGQGQKEFSGGVEHAEANQEDTQVYTNGIISEIRNLVSDISSTKGGKTKSKEAQESILQEIEKLAAEAYSIFRSSVPTFSEKAMEDAVKEDAIEAQEPPVKISSGTGSGFEILCQGFNWESHKSGRWYMELYEKAAELSSLGFTVVWLPPPTESVSPEGYMPKDLYNLNSRYGNMDELKRLVQKFHEVGIKVLGDVVLNHRCAHKQNHNGIWNIFGGRLDWDDRAVVADDPHFQGKGNKSSGDNFHAAPNIDHSQEFVRRDIKEWLCWLREEIGYDGWRLDFVRGFWGGYVKDYLDASEPYFAVGEYWDSLSYTYGEMDHNQDAHRQRIIDWINATNGTAGAFDVTTKGVLHSALERCEYWRLSDQKGKPPGVVGWWPSRAVTFIENHDTGSTQNLVLVEKELSDNDDDKPVTDLQHPYYSGVQGHWRFPGGNEMQGYAYILTHPGTPAVFYDHVFSHCWSEIRALISLRSRNKIHCRSTVQITKVERDVYAAIIDKKLAMKIGPGHYEPQSESQKWSLSLEGNDYKVWEAS